MTDHQDSNRPALRDLACKGQDLKRLIEAGLSWLEQNHQSVNALNVFPVPDGDTGTNMLLTMRSAYSEIADDDSEHAGKIAQKVAHGALMGARGNSGVILSQIWRGFSRKIEKLPAFDTHQFAAAMREASDTAYKGVVKPVEGTILTVVRQAAEAAEIAAQSTDSLVEALSQVILRCHQAVAETPRLLKVLADAGVVDAGGQGFTVILEGMYRFLKGESLRVELPSEYLALNFEAVGAAMETIEPGQDWEVVVDFRPAQPLDLPTFFGQLELMGTSIQLGEGDQISRLHIHLGKAKRYEPIEFIEMLGTVVNVHMENLLDQMEMQKTRAGAAGAVPLVVEKHEIQPGQIAAIAVAPGDGIAAVFASLGVARIVSGGQTMNPSTEEIVAAIESVGTDKIIVLPNNKNIIMAARSACELCGKKALTVPTRTIPQGVSALLALDPDGDLDEVVAAMTAAAAEVLSGEITLATRDVELDGVRIESGNVLGLADGRVCSAGADIQEVIRETLEKMGIEDRELLTLYFGSDTAQADADAIAGLIQDWYPDLEVELVYGGQPHYYYIISVE